MMIDLLMMLLEDEMSFASKKHVITTCIFLHSYFKKNALKNERKYKGKITH